MSNWDELERRLHESQVRAFGDRQAWRHIPMVGRPNKQPLPDPSRRESEINGVFMNPSRYAPGMTRREGGQTLGSNPVLQVHESELHAVLKQGDILVRGNGKRYLVSVPRANGYGTIDIELLEA